MLTINRMILSADVGVILVWTDLERDTITTHSPDLGAKTTHKNLWLSCHHEATVLYSWRWSLGNITSVQWLLAESSPLQGAMTGTNAHIMCQTCCTSALRRLNYRPEQQLHQPSPFHMTAAICLYFRERKMSLLTTLTATVTDTLLVVIFGAYGKIDHLILQIFLSQELLWLMINF